MELTPDQYNEINRKLTKYFLDYSIKYGKNVVQRYVIANNTPTVGFAGDLPNPYEFMGILTKE